MSDADKAYELAQRAITNSARFKSTSLNLNEKKYRELDRLPPEIATLAELRTLRIDSTKITDLSPLRSIPWLRILWMNSTPVTDIAHLSYLSDLQILDLNSSNVKDLRPVSGLSQLGSLGVYGLTFRSTPAVEFDPNLADLAEIDDIQIRTRETLAYLRSLPPWPAPYTPVAIPEGSQPQQIGSESALADPQEAKSQIAYLLRNATGTRLSAQEFACQIRTALQGVPATDGNKLAEPLQTMLEFADVLDRLAPHSEPATDPLDRAKLELRIAQLETLVARLTHQLRDESTAREAAEVLAGKGAFARSFQQEAGKQVARVVVWVPSMVICTGFYQAATHYLGVGNPVLEAMSQHLLKPGN